MGNGNDENGEKLTGDALAKAISRRAEIAFGKTSGEVPTPPVVLSTAEKSLPTSLEKAIVYSLEDGRPVTLQDIEDMLKDPKMMKLASLDADDKTVNTKALDQFKKVYAEAQVLFRRSKNNFERGEVMPENRTKLMPDVFRKVIKTFDVVLTASPVVDIKRNTPQEVPKVLNTEELIVRLDSVPARIDLLRKIADEKKPFDAKIKALNLSVTKNADLDGYIAYKLAVTHIKNALLDVPQSKESLDEQKVKIAKLFEGLVRHQARVREALIKHHLEAPKVGTAPMAPRVVNGEITQPASAEKVSANQPPKVGTAPMMPREVKLKVNTSASEATSIMSTSDTFKVANQAVGGPNKLIYTLSDAVSGKPIEKAPSEEGFSSLKVTLLDTDKRYTNASSAFYNNDKWFSDFARLGRAANPLFGIGYIPKELATQEGDYLSAMQKFRDGFEKRYMERLARTPGKNANIELLNFRASFAKKYLTERIEKYKAIKELALPESKKTPLMLMKVWLSRRPKQVGIALGLALAGSALATGGTSLIALGFGIVAKKGVEMGFTGKLAQKKEEREAAIIDANTNTDAVSAYKNIKRATEVEDAIKSGETLAKYVAGVSTGALAGGSAHALGLSLDLSPLSPFASTSANAAIPSGEILQPLSQESVLSTAPLGDVSNIAPEFAAPTEQNVYDRPNFLNADQLMAVDEMYPVDPQTIQNEAALSQPQTTGSIAPHSEFIYHAPDTGGLMATTWEGTKAFVREIDPSVDLRTQEEITQYFVERYLDNHQEVAAQMGIRGPHYIVQPGQDLPFPVEASAWLHKAVELVKAGNGIIEVNPDGTFVNDVTVPHVHTNPEISTPTPEVIAPKESIPAVPKITDQVPVSTDAPPQATVEATPKSDFDGVIPPADLLNDSLTPIETGPKPIQDQIPTTETPTVPETVPQQAPEVQPQPVPSPIPPETLTPISPAIETGTRSSIPAAVIGGAVNFYNRERIPLTQISQKSIDKVLQQLEYAIEEHNGQLFDKRPRLMKLTEVRESVLDKIYNMKQDEFDQLSGMPPTELITELNKRNINSELFIKWRNYFAQQPLFTADKQRTVGQNLSSAAESAITSGQIKV